MDSSSEETGDDVYERHFAALRRQGFFQRCPEDPYQARSLHAVVAKMPRRLDACADAQGVLRRSARRARPAAGFGEESEDEDGEGAASQRRGNWCVNASDDDETMECLLRLSLSDALPSSAGSAMWPPRATGLAPPWRACRPTR